MTRKEVLEERTVKDGTLKREVRIGEDGSREVPHWYLYYYQDLKPGVRKLTSTWLGEELPEEYR